MLSPEQRGYYGIGIYRPKCEMNIGTLWRSAYQFGAAFIFTIGQRYKKQCSDTFNSFKHIPLMQFENIEAFKAARFYDCPTICIEMCDKAVPIIEFVHPTRCIYLLGAEDNGLPLSILADYKVISLSAVRQDSLNVAVTGSIVMHDRISKGIA